MRPVTASPRLWACASLSLIGPASGFDVLDPIDPEPGIRSPLERLVEAGLPRTVCHGCLVFSLSHRPWVEAFEDPIRDFLGYDGGFLRVRIDLRVGLTPWLDVGATRTNGILRERYDAWSGDARTARRFELPGGGKLDAGLEAGVTWFEQEEAPDALAAWFRNSAGVVMGPVWTGIGLDWHGNSSSPDKRSTDPDATLAVHAESIVRLRSNLSLAAELAKPVAGYGYRHPAWTFGPRWNTWRHAFSVWVGNARTGGPDGRVVGAKTWGSPVLGFQLVREATLWNTRKPP